MSPIRPDPSPRATPRLRERLTRLARELRPTVQLRPSVYCPPERVERCLDAARAR